MSEPKPGEQFKQVWTQDDKDGWMVSRVTLEWFGMERNEANTFQLGAIGVLKDYVQGLSDATYGPVVVSDLPLGQAKKT